MHPLLNTAIKAARAAGKVIIRSLDKKSDIKIASKGHNDFVTATDLAAETAILAIIQQAYPHHAILTEESGNVGEPSSDYLWIIDPLDGTTNYIHDLPYMTVSIAVKYKDKIQHGVIYNPFSGDLFSASYGYGAYCNSSRLRVSTRQNINGGLLGIGFPYRSPKLLSHLLNTIQNIFPQIAGLRILGSAALTLAHVAAGHLDGCYLISNLQQWDFAAGALIIREAGGLVSDLNGGEDFIDGNIIAANPKVLKCLLKISKC